MPDDDLHAPLGLKRKAAPRPRLRGLLLPCLLGCGVLAGWAFLHGLGPAPEAPQAVAAIVPAPSVSAPRPSPIQRVAAAASHETNIQTAAEIEQESGVKVIRADGGTPPDSTIIEVPQGQALAPAPDPRLVEHCRYGILPRIGPDGARPADVYARPVELKAAAKAGNPRIAIIVGGLGLSGPLTEQAIADLPGPVSFAFAPYGRDLAAEVAAARGKGHEVILQLPMEPIDYPQTNPGPHLLLTQAGAAQNTDNLHWLMSRFTGYVGVANFLGAKLTADGPAFAPILQEIGERGLLYLDDGTSPQSLAMTLATEDHLPAAKADLVLDAAPEGIDAALVKLEAIARTKGLAIGMASALPESLEKIGRFARAAQARGLTLIPLSAAVGRSTPDVADRDQ